MLNLQHPVSVGLRDNIRRDKPLLWRGKVIPTFTPLIKEVQPDGVIFNTVWIPAKSKNSKEWIWVDQRNEGEVSLVEVTWVTRRKGDHWVLVELPQKCLKKFLSNLEQWESVSELEKDNSNVFPLWRGRITQQRTPVLHFSDFQGWTLRGAMCCYVNRESSIA